MKLIRQRLEGWVAIKPGQVQCAHYKKAVIALLCRTHMHAKGGGPAQISTTASQFHID